LALALFYALLSAVVLNSFLLKWSFRESVPLYGLESMINETAGRPFVYRQLLPQAIRGVDSLVSQSQADALSRALDRWDNAEKFLSPGCRRAESVKHICPGGGWDNPRFRLHYFLMYCLCFACLFGALWVMRARLADRVG